MALTLTEYAANMLQKSAEIAADFAQLQPFLLLIKPYVYCESTSAKNVQNFFLNIFLFYFIKEFILPILVFNFI